jgi:hypothetical protein
MQFSFGEVNSSFAIAEKLPVFFDEYAELLGAEETKAP